jgi:hypothetical protein
MWGGRAQAIGCHYHPSILDDKGIPNLKNHTNDFKEDMDMSYVRLTKDKEQRTIEAPILKYEMKQPRPKKGLQELTPPTFQVLWANLPSTIRGPRWGPQLYGINLTMYLTMVRLQLPLPQAIVLPSKPKKEASSMDKANFSIVGLGSQQKGDSQWSTDPSKM